MDFSEIQSSGKTSLKARSELKGPRPSPLKLQKKFSVVKKHQPAPQPPRHRPRSPVVIYLVSPKIIHVEPDEFMSIVQRLTGAGSASSALATAYQGIAHDATSNDSRIKDGTMITFNNF